MSNEPNELARYRLSEWPFREVPEPTRCNFLAGRPDLSETLERFISRTNPVSSVHLFWASLGAGKTHALFYLTSRLRSSARFLPIYTEYPESEASFLAIYQSLAQRIPWNDVTESCLHLFTNPDPTANKGLAEIKMVHPDIYRAFFLIAEGEEPVKTRIARRWIRGERLSATDLRAVGLSHTLSTPSECAAAISVLARVLGLKSKLVDQPSQSFRLVWILDESQRLAKAPRRLNHEINAGLQSAFNSTPDYFSLILSFSGIPEKTLPKWLRPELADRIGARSLILLPPFNRQQAKKFFMELLANYQTSSTHAEPFFPFTESAVDYMVVRVLKGKLALIEGFTEQAGVRPRALIKCAHAVLEEHQELGEDPPIDERFVARVFPKG